jgi:hypothetical protein
MEHASWNISASCHASAASAKEHSLLYCGPFVFCKHEPADAVQVKKDKTQDTESCDRRVMITPNTDGQAYSLAEFIEYFGDRATGMREWRRATPVHGPFFPDSSDNFINIKKALIRLLDEGEAVNVPWRRRVCNAKLPRTALLWGRFVRKLRLFLRNDSTGRLCSGRRSARAASARHP